jgi:hypothetical protein
VWTAAYRRPYTLSGDVNERNRSRASRGQGREISRLDENLRRELERLALDEAESGRAKLAKIEALRLIERLDRDGNVDYPVDDDDKIASCDLGSGNTLIGSIRATSSGDTPAGGRFRVGWPTRIRVAECDSRPARKPATGSQRRARTLIAALRPKDQAALGTGRLCGPSHGGTDRDRVGGDRPRDPHTSRHPRVGRKGSPVLAR